MIKSALKIVCDSGPIIHLDELNCLHLLEDFQEILLPDTVYKEIKRYRPLKLKNSNLPFVLSAGTIPNNSTLITLCSIFSLDVGETEADEKNDKLHLNQRPQGCAFQANQSCI
jgi:predicted nucleic acid-binding protein